MATKKDKPPHAEKPAKRLHTVALRLDDEALAEIREEAEREMRPVANLLALLVREAMDARKARRS